MVVVIVAVVVVVYLPSNKIVVHTLFMMDPQDLFMHPICQEGCSVPLPFCPSNKK